MKELAALVAGLVFSLGLILSGMTNPENVLNFLDITGNWNPALAFVLMAAVGVTGLGYRIAWKRERPLLDASFSVPTSKIIDERLIVGSAIFGVGWGLVGLCPGPAFANMLTSNGPKALVFMAAVAGGILLQRQMVSLIERRASTTV